LDEQVCRDRLGVRLDVDAALKALASLTVGVVLIETPSVAACTATESWQRLVAAASKQSIRLVIVPITSPEKTTPQQIASLDATSVDVVLPLTAVTISKEPNKLDLATALWSMLSSDRADHLVTTVVADVYGQTLGLVYSSEESIRESLRTGTGVYQSRKRGLWYKGASSGDTQRLVRIETDCDRDALCFIVVQEGRGKIGRIDKCTVLLSCD
jgi:phosphoribosyl-ATP pyrophosphohydrolase/phosphoribosyl-AMP cyclohydrolase/histidinol dehydrogenase